MSETLYVVYKMSGQLPPGAQVLSFLPASDDRKISLSDVEYYSGRELLEEIRPVARQNFRSCLMRPFATPLGLTRRTFRQRMISRCGFSLWWYHSSSQKSTVEPGFVYTDTIQIMCVDALAQRLGVQRIALAGAPAAHYHCLKSKYNVQVYSSEHNHFSKPMKERRLAKLAQKLHLCKAILKERYHMFREALLIARNMNKLRARKDVSYDVLLQAYWPWSMNTDGKSDRYFCNLPQKCRAAGYDVGYIFTIDFKRPILDGDLDSLKYIGSGVFIESYYSIREIILYALDFRPFFIYLFVSRIKKFRDLFRIDGLDFWHLHRDLLLYGFLGFDIVRSRLRESALCRLLNKLQPRAVGTFLEFFIESRPVYAACYRLDLDVLAFTVQHAIVNADKTFDYIDGACELQGEPDGMVCPHPDIVFAMSQFTFELWKRNGYPQESMFNTGGLRYEHVKIQKRNVEQVTPNILLVASMNYYQDFDMALACFEATRNIPQARIRFRDHPHMRTTDLEQFNALKERIQISSCSLTEDLEWADLVIFAHSTVGEEALVAGLPAWQWIWPGCQPSALYDFGYVPRFASVEELERAFRSFLRDPGSYAPSPELQETILSEFFGRCTSDAAQRIADSLDRKLRK